MTTAIKTKGFTLIELMIVMTIVGMLAAISLPSYNKYLRNAARAEAQSQMLKLGIDLGRWRSKNLSYTGFLPDTGFATTAGSLVTVNGATIYLPIGSTSSNYKYQLALLDSSRTAALTSTDIRAGQGWIMIAQPNTANSTLSLASRLVLSSQGVRCMSDSATSDTQMKANIANVASLSDGALCTSSKSW